jgi:integrase/recombinase XerD
MKPDPQIILDTRYSPKAGANAGKYQIKIRITFVSWSRGKKKWDVRYYLTRQWVTEKEFNTYKDSRAENLKQVRREVNKLKSKADRLINEQNITDPDSFELHFLAEGKLHTIDHFFNVKATELEQDDQINTAKKYKSALNVLKELMGNDIAYGEITPEWLKKAQKKYTDTGRELSSWSFHVRCLRHIYRKAVREKVVPAELYPFGIGKYTVPTSKRNIKRYLTAEQKERFISYRLQDDRLNYYHDLWIFSYYCNGINFVDIANLKRKDIKDDYIIIDRQKGRTTKKDLRKIIIPLRKEILEIIARRGVRSLDPESYVFPILQADMGAKQKANRISHVLQNTNAVLKTIAEDLKLGYVTTYTARHTFSYMLIQLGASTEDLQDALGHGEARTTENYKHGLAFEKKKKYSEGL